MMGNAVRQRSLHEGLITALSIGGFFIILGFVFGLTPAISQNTNSFFSDLTTVTFPFGNPGSTASLFAPAHPADHQGFYSAVLNFLIGVGVLQIVILALRLAVHSRIRRIAQSVGDLIFWLGAAVMASVFLLAGTQSGWFQFWSSLIVLIGVSLIARFFVYLAKRHFQIQE
jgi:hypothetical protein